MLRWNAGIYMDDKVKENPKKYRRLVRKRKVVQGCYCITLPANEKNCMDIYSSREYWFRHHRGNRLEIIGLAADKAGVGQILCQMAGDIMEAFGGINAQMVQRYFADNGRKAVSCKAAHAKAASTADMK